MNRPDLAGTGRDSSLRAVTLFVFAVGLIAVLQPELWPTERQRSLRGCVVATLARSGRSLTLAESHRSRYPNDWFATAIAAEARGRLFEQAASIELFEQLPKDGGHWEFVRQLGTARRYVVLGWLDDAERAVRGALALDPFHTEANDLLGKILLWEGRNWEAVEPQFRVLMRGRCRGDELIGVTATERFFPTNQDLNLNIAKMPEKAIAMKIAAARRLAFDGQTTRCERLLRETVTARPELGEAQGRLGRIVADRGDPKEFLLWRESVPEEAALHPEVLFAEGLMARRLRRTESATHCFLRALELSPNHLGANIQAAICLEQLGKPKLATTFSRRGGVLSDLETKLNLIRDSADRERMQELATMLGGIGRFWEAAGWNYVVTQTGMLPGNAKDETQRWLSRAFEASRGALGADLPTDRIHSTDFPAPPWREILSGEGPLPSPGSKIRDRLARRWGFTDDARESGIDFSYFEGTTESTRLQHICNVMGGGLGAFDFDQDGWPDLYLAQGNHWENPADGPQLSDKLYRNVMGARFADVTGPARIADSDFSHGVTAGDFNQDGFPDVHIGNLGPNRLYENMGDGTLEDVTTKAGVAGNEWSTSSVFADLNEDGLPDLYVLNYTEADATRLKICRRSDQRQMACTPDVLPAEYDRLYLNEGDGRFRDVTEASGARLPDGRGLGVLAWDFDGDGRLGLFVGNDTTENFLFVNRSAKGAVLPELIDEGVVRGCAFDINGNAQATMGIAAGDITGDGRIDLLTTNFFADGSTLYSQSSDGSFEDKTREMNVREPSFWMLGFGSQFSDFDCDGWNDAIVTNGHVDQRSSRGDPDRMPPQLFHNLEGQTFAEVPSVELGAFFQGAYLGRGLATLDWNGDGLTDVGISHLHAPFALLTNRTAPVDRPLSIRLIGRRGCRDPIGSSVTVRAKDREMVRLLTGGDGFLVTNERRMLFAVPRDAESIEVTVRWHGGSEERLTIDATSGELAIPEGTGRVFRLRDFPSSSDGSRPK